ncbi:MAG: c-type cytochrome [Leptolyngbya sp. SIO1E4]|nr:c-type cytochrome [Leptolyngbya sp. SIO1E4]
MQSRWICLGCVIVTLFAWLSVVPPVRAAEHSLETAQQIFTVQCAGCHAHGGNIVRRGKTLKQRALKRNGVDSVTAIATLITQGKGIMSAYGDRLSPEEIDLLATYVWENAQNNWR